MTTVFVAIYEHRHGNDIRVFKSPDGAETWKQELAQEYWSEVFEGEPIPSDPAEASEDYWNTVHGEWFSYETCEVEE